jgi:hypothetical protein
MIGYGLWVARAVASQRRVEKEEMGLEQQSGGCMAFFSMVAALALLDATRGCNQGVDHSLSGLLLRPNPGLLSCLHWADSRYGLRDNPRQQVGQNAHPTENSVLSMVVFLVIGT